MKRFFQVSRYPAVLVFVLAGFSAVIVAYASFNLLTISMANLHFIQAHGWLALRSGALIQLLGIGALIQLLGIAFYGVIALASFLIFKICESELVLRYRRWQDR